MTARWYGVSYGNGNDGVSQFDPAYLVYTDDPYTLARAAQMAEWKDRRWAKENTDVDGEADCGVNATVYEGPNGETQFGAAERIVSVFPVTDVDRYGCPRYDSMYTGLFDVEVMKLVQEGIDT